MNKKPSTTPTVLVDLTEQRNFFYFSSEIKYSTSKKQLQCTSIEHAGRLHHTWVTKNSAIEQTNSSGKVIIFYSFNFTCQRYWFGNGQTGIMHHTLSFSPPCHRPNIFFLQNWLKPGSQSAWFKTVVNKIGPPCLPACTICVFTTYALFHK